MGQRAGRFAPEIATVLETEARRPRNDSRVGGVVFITPNLTLEAAAKALGQIGSSGAPVANELIPLLYRDSAEVRAAASSALAGCGPRVVKDVLPLLHDGSAEVRGAAAQTLRLMGENEAAGAAVDLASLLDDGNADVRAEAASALGRTGEEAAAFAEKLFGLRNDPDWRVRNDAFVTLARFPGWAPRVAPLLQDAKPEIRYLAVDALGRMGEDGAAFASEVALLLDDNDQNVRRWAVTALGMMGSKGTPFAGKLVQWLRINDAGLEEEVLDSLGKMSDHGAPFAKDVAALLENNFHPLRADAATALSQMGKSGAVYGREITKLFDDKDCNVGARAAMAIGKLGKEEPAMAQVVAPLLDSDNHDVRCTAADALAYMGRNGAAYAKEIAAFLKDPSMREAAIFPLEQFRLPELVTPYLGDADPEVRESSAQALRYMGEAALPFIKQIAAALYSVPHEGVRAEVLGSILDAHGNPNADFGLQAALLAVAITAPARDLPALRAHLRLWSGDNAAMQRSVSWLGKPDSVPSLQTGGTPGETQETLVLFLRLWDHTADKPALRAELVERIAQVAKTVAARPDVATANALNSLAGKLKFEPSANPAYEAVEDALRR
jgi:HEAT repeat protein